MILTGLHLIDFNSIWLIIDYKKLKKMNRRYFIKCWYLYRNNSKEFINSKVLINANFRNGKSLHENKDNKIIYLSNQ